MGFEKRLFDIIGNRFRIDDTGEYARVTWQRLSFGDMILFFPWGVMAAIIVAGITGMERMAGIPLDSLGTPGLIILGICWAALGAHLFFNRRSELRIDKTEIRFRKRPYLSRLHLRRTAEIRDIQIKATSQFYESDTGYYPDISHFYILFDGGKRLRLDSFNEEDCEKLKGTIESFR